MSNLFHQIQDATAILRNKGVFKQVPLYLWRGKVYAKWGSGFIGLRRNNGTTLPNVGWEHAEGVEMVSDDLGVIYQKGSNIAKHPA